MKKKIKSKYIGKVLVLGNDNRSFLSVIRSLGRRNICVHVGWCDLQLPAIHSKYISEYKNIPPFTLSDENWKKELIKILQKENYDLVIPCNDQSIIPLQLNKNEFDNISMIYLLSDNCYKIANDKFQMQNLVTLLGINTPKELSLSNLIKAEYILSEMAFPVVIKPRSSFVEDDLHTKKSVYKAYTLNELQAYLNKIKNKDFFCAQENFIGNGVGIEVLAHQGNVLYSFQHIRIHEPIYGGGSSYRKSSKQNPELLEATKKIIKELNYTGVAMVEFKMNLKNNNWVFIEFNARFWGSLPLAVSAGADFPYFLFSMLVNKEKKFSSPYKKGIYCRNLTSDLKWFISNLNADRSNPTLMSLPLWKVGFELFNILLFKERNDSIVLDDIKPGVKEVSRAIIRILIELRTKLYSLPIIRKLYTNRTKQFVRKANNVLFVCKGNICRSPFAHFYLESLSLPEVNISSCGYYPEENRSCPMEAIVAAKYFSIDLSLHHSRIANNEMISKADIIFIFDTENYRNIVQRFPAAKPKIRMIGSLNSTCSFIINDPFGQDINTFIDTYKNIKQLLDSFVSVRNSKR